MKFLNDKLGTELSVQTVGDALYFDLEEIARNLGAKNVKDTVRHFCDKYEVNITREVLVSGGTFVDEGDMYLFVLRSNSSLAVPFQRWVCSEVLPSVRRVGMDAIKKLEIARIVGTEHYSSCTQEMLEARGYDKTLVSESLKELGCHIHQGFFSPSHFNIKAVDFRKWLVAQEYTNEQGDPQDKAEGLYLRVPKYDSMDYKWSAWRESLFDQFSQ